jgi:alginate O-acetyltransferase complex protein AlgJ
LHKHIIAIIVALAAAIGADAQTEPVGADAAQAFAAECAAKAAAADKAGQTAVAGRDGWLFLAAELRHIGAGRFWGEDAAKVSRAAKPEDADPLPAILDFQRQLADAGIELIVVPVPPKAFVYPEMLSDRVTADKNAPPPRLDAGLREFLQVLRSAGVKVIDLVPEFLANRFHKDGALYCRTDSHLSGNGCVLAARRIGEEVRDRPWLASAPAAEAAYDWRTIEISGDLRQALPDPNAAKEKVPLRFVGKRVEGTLAPLQDDRAGPIVVLGDSSDLIYHAGDDMFATGAGLPDQLALQLGVTVDVVAVRGSGATAARVNLMRRAAADPNYLKGKRLVIWCFAAREFTEGDGWKKVPLTPAQ